MAEDAIFLVDELSPSRISHILCASVNRHQQQRDESWKDCRYASGHCIIPSRNR
jgi:hypothetical protein